MTNPFKDFFKRKPSFGFLRPFKQVVVTAPETPTRMAKCSYCGEEALTEVMEGAVIHLMCKTKRDEEMAEERKQIDLIKKALKEYFDEKYPK